MNCNSQLPQRIDELLEAAREGFENLSIKESMELLCVLETRRSLLEIENNDLHNSLKKLEIVRDKYADLFDLALVPFIFTDETGKLIELNHAGMDLLNFQGNQWRGVPLAQCIISEDQKLYTQHLQELKDSRFRQSCQLRLKRHDSQPHKVKFDSLVMRGLQEQGLKIQTIVMDITNSSDRPETLLDQVNLDEVARLKDELHLMKLEKTQSLSILAGGVAHNFNNLLMVISGNADLGLMEIPKDSPMRESLEEIKSAALRAAHLSNQMRAYSGQGHAVLTQVNLNELLEEHRALLVGSVGKNGELKFDLASEELEIQADSMQIQQLVTNLVTNAAESLDNAARIVTVRTDRLEVTKDYLAEVNLSEDIPPGEYVSLEVNDTGCGMAPEIQEKIFDPFFTTKFTGRGLGLAVVLGVVRGHGGAISVKSKPGAGSTFRILIPATPREQVKPAMEYLPVEEDGMGMVLIVDDDDAILHLTKLMLEKDGMEIATAESGQRAVDLFQLGFEDISVVLLDIAMPGMGGEETFRQLREIRKDIPIIVCSGLGEETVIQSFIQQGCVGFLQKPFNFGKLIEMIRKSRRKYKEKSMKSDKFPL